MTVDSAVSVELLRGAPIFEALNDEHLEKLAALARRETVLAGETVVWARKPADTMYLVLDGRVALALQVPGQPDFVVTSVSSGRVFGWSALAGQQAWMATARALKNTTLLLFPGRELVALCDDDHELGYVVMRRLFTSVAARVHDAWLQLLDMYGRE